MKLRAYVENALGNTTHCIGTVEGSVPKPSEIIDTSCYLEIVQDDSGVFLVHYNSSGVAIADTWHGSITEAKAQAEYEFGLTDDDWGQIDD